MNLNPKSIQINGETVNFSVVSGSVLSTKKYVAARAANPPTSRWLWWLRSTDLSIVDMFERTAELVDPNTTREQQDIWIKTDKGKEKHIQLEDCAIPLRNGQEITLLFASTAKEESELPLFLCNHNAKTCMNINSTAALVGRLGLANKANSFVMLCLAAAFLVAMAVNIAVPAETTILAVKLLFVPLALSFLHYLMQSFREHRNIVQLLEPTLKRVEEQLIRAAG